jgi:hypothetical protein
VVSLKDWDEDAAAMAGCVPVGKISSEYLYFPLSYPSPQVRDAELRRKVAKTRSSKTTWFPQMGQVVFFIAPESGTVAKGRFS